MTARRAIDVIGGYRMSIAFWEEETRFVVDVRTVGDDEAEEVWSGLNRLDGQHVYEELATALLDGKPELISRIVAEQKAKRLKEEHDHVQYYGSF